MGLESGIGGAPFRYGDFGTVGNMAVAIRATGLGQHVHPLDDGTMTAKAVVLNGGHGVFTRMDQIGDGAGDGFEHVTGPLLGLKGDFWNQVVGGVAFVAGELGVNGPAVGQGRFIHGMAAPAESGRIRGGHGHGCRHDKGDARRKGQQHHKRGFSVDLELPGKWHSSSSLVENPRVGLKP